MPTLNWIGKEKVVNHHRDVPYCVLDKQYTFDNNGQHPVEEGIESKNMIIHGDNLYALKSLLPLYEGKVDLVYIDPPYNTGNEKWVYNDNVNDPRIKKWLGDVVGKEGEDLSRHDKWLCMMYPRLTLLRKLLSPDGLLFISIDDTEQSNLRLICDEIFGLNNFVACIAWEKRYTRSNNAKRFYSLKDSILVYRRDSVLTEIKEKRTEKADSNYSNPDNDPNGPWISSSYVNPATKNARPNLVYPISAPDGRIINHLTHAWKYSEIEHKRHVENNMLWWGSDGHAKYPRLKKYLNEASGMVPVDLWHYQDVGTTDDGGKEIKSIFGKMIFDTPKPTSLIQKIISICNKNDAIVLDSFAGSGTTAHAVIKQNHLDGGNRQFILIEMEEYANVITAERVKRAICGYEDNPGIKSSFSFYELGELLLNEDGNINENVPIEKIKEYVFYTETKTPYVPPESNIPYYLGRLNGTSYYFIYEKDCKTTLDEDFITNLSSNSEEHVVFADRCTISKSTRKELNIIFKKIPRDISRF